MTAVVLVGYAIVLAGPVAWLLRRAAWTSRAPRLAVAAWQVVSLSIVLAVGLAGLVLIVPVAALTGGLATLIEACVDALRVQYATLGGAATSTVAIALLAVMVVRVGYTAVVCFGQAIWQRRRQRAALALIGHRDDELGAVVVDHTTAVAYCLPGRGRQVVLTSAAVCALDPAELRAVLAHEQAHLRERHHLVLAGAQVLDQAFPFVPAFRWGRVEVARLVELIADDAATRHCERHTIAHALVALAAGTAPTAALGAGGPTTPGRVDRLLAPARPLQPIAVLLGAAALATLVAVPLLLAAGPAVAATQMPYCPLPY